MGMHGPTDVPKDYVVLDSETTGLDPSSCIVTAVGIGSPSDGIEGDDIEVEHIEKREDEPELIRWVRRKLSDYDTENVVGWNLRFDFRFLRTRGLIRRVPDPFRNSNMIDDMYWMEKYAGMDDVGLEDVADALDIGAKIGKGESMPELYREGNYAEIVEHCRQDVLLTMEIHERILEVEGKKESNPFEVSPEEELPEIST